MSSQQTRIDHQPLDGVLPWAIDEAEAGRLWTLSERMTGLRFAI
ncbi:hypothetical protein [Burkholderia gladioli]|nr:hypothetical protein [Burkholderia gladioli]MDA0572264.1 hypothetical protein [Burkholderia gladioli]MDA0600423.1 hypothetical protein [Burkholderia gladioli]